MGRISDSELEIMKVLWEGAKLTSSQIIGELSNKTSWSKTTIKTLLTRLVTKGVVKREKNKNSLYYYEALISEEDYKKEENENFIAKLYKGSFNNMLLNFVQQKQISKKDLEDLIKMIEEE